MPNRMRTLEEAKNAPLMTEVEQAEAARAIAAFVTNARVMQAAHVARGGYLMTAEELQDLWDHRRDDDDGEPSAK